MSIVTSENVFMSAIQPNTSVTTYGLPSEILSGHGSSHSDEQARAKRVQQQVQMRLAQKTTRQNGTAGQYASSDYGGGISTLKYQTYNPGFTSKSQMYSTRTMVPRMSQYSGGVSGGGFSSRSAVDLSQLHRMSVGGGGGAGVGGGGASMYQQDDMRLGGTRQQMSTMTRTMTRGQPEIVPLHPMHQQAPQGNAWMVDYSDADSLVSDRDATFGRQYASSMANGYTGQVRQGPFPGTMRRSLSGTLAGNGAMGAGEAEFVQQHSFKGPAHRTISRINNRTRMSMGTSSTTSTTQRQVSGTMDKGFIMGASTSGSQGNLLAMQHPALYRAMSIKSMHSVGKGADIFDGQENGSLDHLMGIHSLDMSTAVQYLRESDPNLQVQGAAYIQHECYNNSDAKQEVRLHKGITELVRLFNSENQEVQRYATGATRNLIYENMENKVALIEEGGIAELVLALKEEDNELLKNITGILWNLSSKDNLKEKLASETLSELTETILIPLSGNDDPDWEQSPSEADIYYNTTGCLRNLSSVSEKTRQQMREKRGLVDALVTYITKSLENSKAEDKGVENAVCVLRNLSYQIYSEMPPSAQQRLEGPTRASAKTGGEAIGCFSAKGKHNKEKSLDLTTFTEVARKAKGMEWLWHPDIVALYHRVLQKCEINSTTREAAAGALQNITAGDKRWASVLSRVALEQGRILPTVLDLLRTNSDLELRSLTGFLRNLSRHARDKNDMSTKVVNNLVTKLPSDGYQKDPSSDVVVNICGILNNLVTSSSVAARDITFFDGLEKLVGIKNSHDSSPGKMKAAKSAATVLCNMFQYKKLHKGYKQKGYDRKDFTDMTI